MPSKLRVTTLAKLFPCTIDKLTNAHIARLCVLFEDLRIEIAGFTLAAPDIGSLPRRSNVSAFDIAGPKARKLYFLRRSIATCSEFAEAIRLLDQLPTFGTIVLAFPQDEQNSWREAVQYFKVHEKTWKLIRNDVGGHFGLAAAMYAIGAFLPDAPVTIEIHSSSTSPDRAGAILGFASEIAATALCKHLLGDTHDQKLKMLFGEIQKAYPHAIKAVECIIGNHLWEKAG